MSVKFFYGFLLAALLAACTANNAENKAEGEGEAGETETPAPMVADGVEMPAGYEKLGEATGNLNDDGQDELVVVFNTDRPGDMGTERELRVYRKTDQGWELWQQSATAVMSSESGGVMGDPFQKVEIQNGAIVLHHFGGSRFKWEYTHRFRFQNDAWQLIGATVSAGAPCEEWDNFDYNLSTGNIDYEKVTENCEDGEENMKTTKEQKTFTQKPASLPAMDGFVPGSNALTLPGVEGEVYY